MKRIAAILVGTSMLCQPAWAAVDGKVAELSCEHRSSKRHVAGFVRVKVKGNEVRAIDYGNYTHPEPGKLGYSCDILAARGDAETKWHDSRVSTFVELGGVDADEKNALTIIRESHGFFIDFREAKNRPACGIGSELPASLHLLFGKKTCSVRYRD